MKQGLFYSLVRKLEGQRVTWPGRPYKHYTIPYSTEPIVLGMEFMAYQGRYLNFIKELEANVKRQHQKVEVVVTEEVKEVPDEIPTEIEKKETNLDQLPDRTHKDAHKEKQKLAYELDPIRNSAGFDKLKKSTKREIYEYVVKVRGLVARYDETVSKGEWISLALHGYRDTIDKDKYMYNTKKLAERWYTKKVLEVLYDEKGHKFNAAKKVDELRQYAWDQGWLRRDAYEIMNKIVMPGEEA